MNRQILLAGFGNMGRALARGWLEADMAPASITVIDPSSAACDLARSMGLQSVDEPARAGTAIDIAVLAVKPAGLDGLLDSLPPARLYLSIAAGRRIAGIQARVAAGAAVVRAMPNTPAAIGQGITGLCAGSGVGVADREAAADLMRAVGAVEWLDDEQDMDALTAVSGSGPAYVFLLIESLTAAAIDAGLEPALAARLALATVRGAGAYAASADTDPAALRRQVTSPGGTTEAALAVLMNGGGLKGLLSDAVRAAAARSRELSADQDS